MCCLEALRALAKARTEAECQPESLAYVLGRGLNANSRQRRCFFTCEGSQWHKGRKVRNREARASVRAAMCVSVALRRGLSGTHGVWQHDAARRRRGV